MKSMHIALSFVSTSASASARAATRAPLTMLAASDLAQVAGGGTADVWGLVATPPVVRKPAA